MKIGLLEDEVEQARNLSDALIEKGHTCEFFHNGQSFLYAVTHNSYDLLIMDWQLPDMEGTEALRDVRKELNWKIPVIFLTQRDSEEDIITALEAGADDYLVKPARIGELVARISALSRRTSTEEESKSETFTQGPFEIDMHARTIQCNGEPVPMTDKDFELAVFMFQNVGRLLSRNYLLERVWGVSSDLNTRTVDTHVSRLRRKLGIKPENGFRIKTIYQHGYRLETVAE
ncbi:response regulator transcription factor [Alkalimarinus coralli]|uniref:response regulator transcription factor n=1 Tax=Alkalimarinus coralli TaxID=2935863 RepID=UPI00202ACD03|nr:response regulator transcription factor [Alkalimarinus coralli]